MKNTLGDDLPLSYWASLVAGDVRWYGKRRKWAGMLRAVWLTVWHRNNIERCNDCGRQYPTWIAPDMLYKRVIGSRRGQFCIGCFDARAEAFGINLAWTPNVTSDRLRPESDFPGLCERIGAFR